MKKKVKEVVETANCQLCEQKESYIHFGEEHICLDCYNEKMHQKLGFKAESYSEGVTIRDSEGKARHFRLKKRLDPIGVIMEAEELAPSGYQFTVHGELDADQGAFLLQLLAKAERGMAETYVKQGRFPNGQMYHSLKNDRLAGRIESDSFEDRTPLLIVDGKSYSWEEIGRMLMAYEGFQLKLEILDSSEEVAWSEEE